MNRNIQTEKILTENSLPQLIKSFYTSVKQTFGYNEQIFKPHCHFSKQNNPVITNKNGRPRVVRYKIKLAVVDIRTN
jgi:hypothetical protein